MLLLRLLLLKKVLVCPLTQLYSFCYRFFFICVYLARRVVCPRFLALRPILQRLVKIRKDGNVKEFIAISSASTPAEAVVEQFEPWQLAAVAAAEGSVGG